MISFRIGFVRNKTLFLRIFVRVVCPNFGSHALTSSFFSDAVGMLRNKNHHLKAETSSKLTVTVTELIVHKCCKIIFHLQKNYFRNDEVKAGCPKLGQGVRS